MTTPDNQIMDIVCGICEKTTIQHIVAVYTHSIPQEINDGPFKDVHFELTYIWRLSLCPSCNGINLTVEDFDGEISTQYPSLAKNIQGLPDKIAQAYKAARAVRRIDANAFAVLLGRVLELVCLDREAHGTTLHDKLQDLAQKGDIPGPLGEMAHQLRMLRNVGAHATLGELTSQEVPILDDLCGAILEYVYTAPSLIVQVKQRMEKYKK